MAMFNKDKARKSYAHLHCKWALGPNYSLLVAGNGTNPRTYQEKKSISYVSFLSDVVPPTQCACDNAAHECIIMGVIEKSEHVIYFLQTSLGTTDLNAQWLRQRPKSNSDQTPWTGLFDKICSKDLSAAEKKMQLYGINSGKFKTNLYHCTLINSLFPIHNF